MESRIHLEFGKRYLQDLKKNWARNSSLAEQHLLEATKNPAIADEAYYYLITLAINTGDYKKAREYINKYQEMFQNEANSSKFYRIYYLVESEEYNFNQALAYRYKHLENSDRKTPMLLGLVYPHLQLGQNEIAKSICMCALKDYHATAQALLMLSNIAIVEQDLEKAKYFLSQIDARKLSAKDFNIYQENKKRIKLLDRNDNYRDQLRLLNEKERKQEFLRHIEKHKNTEFYGNDVFHQDIDLEELYQQLVEATATTNEMYFPGIVKYKVLLDQSIGMKHGEETKAAEVVATGERSFVTTYPILVSPSFNQENLLQDQKLMELRLQHKGGTK